MSESGRLKRRSQNLLHFSLNRISSDAEAQYNAGAPKSEALPARSATPQVGNHQQAPLPTKKELAALARLPTSTARPKPAANSPRKPLGGGNSNVVVQPLPDSPPRKLPLGRMDQITQVFRPQHTQIPEPAPVADREEHDETKSIFAGDSLPDDCLASGYTTELMVGPDEEADNFKARVQSQHDEPLQAAPNRRENESKPERPERLEWGEKHHHAPKPANGGFVFHTDGSGKMAVAHIQQRLEASQVGDGFRNEPLAERRPYHATQHYRPATTPPPPQARTEIPIRQVNVAKEQRAHKKNHHSRNYSSAYEKEPAPKQSRRTVRKQEPRTVINLTDDGGPDSDGYEDEEDIYETPRPKAKQSKARTIPKDHLLESALPPPTMDLSNHQSRKRNRPMTDYDDKVLGSMSWADLQKEPFDQDPSQAAAHSHGQGGSETDQLTKNLEQLKSKSDEDQRAFFCTTSMDDWEKSGDWFVDQFADLMKKLRDARRAKREMVSGFEKEAAQREEAVRQRSEAIDRKLAKMKQDGRRVVGGG
ncbi:extracellular mutant protein 11-domain-containing protein [Emericellopsis atlantica]|uniref:Extracellular mutant protein 11-domain-containing protein n=1 Tax=Emericellopsis atlantica TaxID=2614577 RepID=A0A9P7ZJQ0_9HYPO|nr:extracellular mutant protein 11-domain-containing protein [Emericellopsis atlantica]KAG9253196.1 extracellular mutant protein 11-domain-containing protein [Emericellopsis atlantica]